MKRTHFSSFCDRSKTQEEEEDTNDGDTRLIPRPPKNYTCSFCRREFKSAQALGGHMNFHRRERAKLRQNPSWLFQNIPIENPSPNFSSSPSSSTTSAQALGGHMNVHRRDTAKLRQNPYWLFQPHEYHIPIENLSPNFSSSPSSSTTTSAHLDPCLTNQRSKKPTTFPTPQFNLLESTTRSYGDLMMDREKNKSSNLSSRELKKSVIDDAYHSVGSAVNRGDLMNQKDDPVMELELGRNPKQVLDLELRLGYL